MCLENRKQTTIHAPSSITILHHPPHSLPRKSKVLALKAIIQASPNTQFRRTSHCHKPPMPITPLRCTPKKQRSSHNPIRKRRERERRGSRSKPPPLKRKETPERVFQLSKIHPSHRKYHPQPRETNVVERKKHLKVSPFQENKSKATLFHHTTATYR